MINEPDYITWASQEVLSPHAIASLFMEMRPTGSMSLKASVFAPAPSIPEGVFDEIDREDWQKTYDRIFVTLRSGISSSSLTLRN